mmetsp:Transcript_15537/g.24862  ORF Transcript_15537/g.24862 Transcript_15537/m.24862 type:complete len:286 (-) Transcript_15537:177-1034(-)
MIESGRNAKELWCSRSSPVPVLALLFLIASTFIGDLSSLFFSKSPKHISMNSDRQAQMLRWDRKREYKDRKFAEDMTGDLEKRFSSSVMMDDTRQRGEQDTDVDSAEEFDEELKNWRKVRLQALECRERALKKAEKYGFGKVEDVTEAQLHRYVHNRFARPVGMLLLLALNKDEERGERASISELMHNYMTVLARNTTLIGRKFRYARFNCTTSTQPYIAREYEIDYWDLPVVVLFYRGERVQAPHKKAGVYELKDCDRFTLPRSQIRAWIKPVVAEAAKEQKVL